jgi:hypothetical protein
VFSDRELSLVALAGLEPATQGLGIPCSIQLSYPIKGFTEPGSAGQDNIAEGGRGRKAVVSKKNSVTGTKLINAFPPIAQIRGSIWSQSPNFGACHQLSGSLKNNGYSRAGNFGAGKAAPGQPKNPVHFPIAEIRVEVR